MNSTQIRQGDSDILHWRHNNSSTSNSPTSTTSSTHSSQYNTSPTSYTLSSSNENLPKLHSLSLEAPKAPIAQPLPTPPTSSSARGIKRCRSSSQTSDSSQGSFSAGSNDDLLAQERKSYADGLIETAVFTVEAIWKCPLPQDPYPRSIEDSQLPLKYFIRETLRRSKTSSHILQVALFYLFKIRDKVKCRRVEAAELLCGNQVETCEDSLLCGRRTFLSALILSNKYLSERNYSNRAWSRMSGLTASEISSNERAFLILIGYDLNVSESTWKRWVAFLRTLVDKQIKLPASTDDSSSSAYTAPTQDCDERSCKRTCLQSSPSPSSNTATPKPSSNRLNEKVSQGVESYTSKVSWEGVKAAATASSNTTKV
ncbi:hypothetical protein E3P99_00081 [Wallemia hederae]|uniref:Cyclin N-terminal domain-containing protein n=1 Tax=Wallemia hederae TaxID=1540922 RepID=A0A4T0FY05_9BASI|nr:hypothetical protein E3P99_00081 [Wallemia hederae]